MLDKYKFIELIKTVGLCPTTLRFFEKNRVKLLSKRNYIAFFGTKLKFSSKLPVGSGQKPISHCVTAPLSWEPKNRRFKAVPEREGGIAKRNGLNLIFSKWKSGFCRNFFIEKVPCTFKNLFKTAHSMCLWK